MDEAIRAPDQEREARHYEENIDRHKRLLAKWPDMIHKTECIVGTVIKLRVHCAPLGFFRTRIGMDPSEITRLIETGFDNAIVQVMSDDNTHFEALVVAEEFEGKRPLARHQLVYRCLGVGTITRRRSCAPRYPFSPEPCWRAKMSRSVMCRISRT